MPQARSRLVLLAVLCCVAGAGVAAAVGARWLAAAHGMQAPQRARGGARAAAAAARLHPCPPPQAVLRHQHHHHAAAALTCGWQERAPLLQLALLLCTEALVLHHLLGRCVVEGAHARMLMLGLCLCQCTSQRGRALLPPTAEAVRLMPGVGVVMESRSLVGRVVRSQFVDQASIAAVIINEVRRGSVRTCRRLLLLHVSALPARRPPARHPTPRAPPRVVPPGLDDH